MDYKKSIVFNPINKTLAMDYYDCNDSSIYYLNDYYSKIINLKKISINDNSEDNIIINTKISFRKFINLAVNNTYILILYTDKLVVYSNGGKPKEIIQLELPKNYKFFKTKVVKNNVFIYSYTSAPYKSSRIRILKYNLKEDKEFVEVLNQLNPHSLPVSILGQNNYIDINGTNLVFSKIHDYEIIIKNLNSKMDKNDTIKRDVFVKDKKYLNYLQKATMKYYKISSQKNFDKMNGLLNNDKILNVKLINDTTLYVYYEKEIFLFDVWTKSNSKWRLTKTNIFGIRIYGDIIGSKTYPLWGGHFIYNPNGKVIYLKDNYKPILGKRVKTIYSRGFQMKLGQPAFIIYSFNPVFKME